MSAESFDASWLALREAVDHRSRASALHVPLRAWWQAHGGRRVLDLGAGTGSNLRYLSAVLPEAQAWTLVDRDSELLSLVKPPAADTPLAAVCEDLSGAGLDRIDDADLVTASALLDLVSESWLTAASKRCAEAGAAALFALSYDGEVEWSGDADPMDARVQKAVNRHQLGDKGFGPALGPAAGPAAEAALRAHGYRTWLVPSPWVLGSPDAALVTQLVRGWAEAAAELVDRREALLAWADRRSEDVARGRVRLTVGHWDLLALPPDPPRS